MTGPQHDLLTYPGIRSIHSEVDGPGTLSDRMFVVFQLRTGLHPGDRHDLQGAVSSQPTRWALGVVTRSQ